VLTLVSAQQVTFFEASYYAWDTVLVIHFGRSSFLSISLSCRTRITYTRSVLHLGLSFFIPSEIFCTDNHDIRSMEFISLLYIFMQHVLIFFLYGR
jgi:hypothetical protein